MLLAMLVGTSVALFVYHAVAGQWLFHSAVGYLIAIVPVVVIGAWGVWRADSLVVNDRWFRRSMLGYVVAFGLLSAPILTMLASGHFWSSLMAVLSTASLLLVCSAILGTIATLTTAILLCVNFRSLPARIPRVLPLERSFVYFWGADREKMLALVDARAPEMTFPRSLLINSTVLTGFLLFQAGVQLLTASSGHTLGAEHNRFLAYLCAVDAF